MPQDDAIELRKDRFFFRKTCAYCGDSDKLELDRIQPFTWFDDGVWKLSDYNITRLFMDGEAQILCDACLRRKKQIWKRYRKEGGSWLKPYLEEAGLDE